MARPGLHQHRKFLRLAERIGGAALARGILEMLWEPAYDSGDDFLGDAMDIWIRCGKPPSINAEDLTAALEECAFIDVDETDGYRIHDLFDHMPPNVARRVEREAVRLERGVTISQLRKQAGRKGGLAKASKPILLDGNPSESGPSLAKGSKRLANASKRLANDATHHSPHSTQLETFAGSAQSATPPPGVGKHSLTDRRKKPRKEPNPRHTPIKARLEQFYEGLLGEKWQYDGGDAKALSDLLTEYPDEEIEARWSRGLRAEFYRVRRVCELKAKWGHHARDAPGTNRPKGPEPNRGPVRSLFRACTVCGSETECPDAGSGPICYPCLGAQMAAS